MPRGLRVFQGDFVDGEIPLTVSGLIYYRPKIVNIRHVVATSRL
jgi:hypothetical protein